MKGLALSVPSLVGRRGLEEVLEIPLSEGEEYALHASARRMKEAIERVEYVAV